MSVFSFGIWKGVMLSSSDWLRSSSSRMSEVSMFSSSSMAFDVPETASSPSDVYMFSDMIEGQEMVRQWSGK